ncbi:MAG: succinate dehydrogenase assembly factor 2 [Sulfuritalea sp.]|nr:succinate dehydrogenase assembly factor 2 [Sulfuritalea sp.]
MANGFHPPGPLPAEGGDLGSAAGTASGLDGVAEDRRARINRLKWHCRRALLELDLVFDRFWERYEDSLDEQGEAALESLLELEDHDLWALVSGRDVTDDPQLTAMIERLREVSPRPILSSSDTSTQRT